MDKKLKTPSEFDTILFKQYSKYKKQETHNNLYLLITLQEKWMPNLLAKEEKISVM